MMTVNEVENFAVPIELIYFLESIREDSRINPVHISLFIAIMQEWNNNNCQNPICIFTRRIMFLSKISGKATYYRSLRELHDYGYIRYKPSHNCLTGTFVQLMRCAPASSPDTEKK